ncbi:ubiquinol-cytochrome C chaperone family protein [Sphingomonas sp.]|uniref:ubiquinol-cytochrome C chaperone family protein n=1 Tax=Sphingomonas sp. TaxID=28214 RepID=UPI00185B872B|nr:ubiquinol-cytochrome C chaperone family protein [Sphingomonas sp.]MBA3512505.1 ubiquinol-cytochrome C chaperone [Sphingomonas sp.]
MLSFLFPRLTSSGASRGSALFAALVGEARRPHWYVDGEVPDSLDGRFAVLATIVALATVRLERGGEPARMEAVALAERFVEAMDAEHRELGLGDPALGRTVRKLVGSLARRVELWRQAIDRGQWDEAVAASLSANTHSPEALAHCGAALRKIWAALAAASDDALAEGRIR